MSWRSCWLVLSSVGVLGVAVSCGSGAQADKPSKPVFPVRGELFVDGTPPAGALVILHPDSPEAQNEAWPQGYPRAEVQSTGAFTVSTYAAGDGAPAGDYTVLVRHMVADPNAQGAGDSASIVDRFQGAFSRPEFSTLKVKVQEQPNVFPRFDLKLPRR